MTVTAVTNTDGGYSFVNWTENTSIVSTDASYTFTLTADRNLAANFERTPEGPEEGTVTVNSITYSTSGGRHQDRHLHIKIALVDDVGNTVAGVSVSINIFWNESSLASRTGTTGSDGTVIFSYNNAPSGDYTTEVTAVDAGPLSWDETTPENEYDKTT